MFKGMYQPRRPADSTAQVSCRHCVAHPAVFRNGFNPSGTELHVASRNTDCYQKPTVRTLDGLLLQQAKKLRFRSAKKKHFPQAKAMVYDVDIWESNKAIFAGHRITKVDEQYRMRILVVSWWHKGQEGNHHARQWTDMGERKRWSQLWDRVGNICQLQCELRRDLSLRQWSKRPRFPANLGLPGDHGRIEIALSDGTCMSQRCQEHISHW